MSQKTDSSPGDEAPAMEPKQTGQSATLPVESGESEPDGENTSKTQGQSSEAPVTG